MQQSLWHAVGADAVAVVMMSRGLRTERPRSMRCMMSQMIYLRAKARFLRLADAETRGRMGDIEIDFDYIEEDWDPSAHNSFNIGIALAIQHLDSYYGMAEFDNPTSPNGTQDRQSMQSSIPFKRDYHLAQCRPWVNMSRPGLWCGCWVKQGRGTNETQMSSEMQNCT